MTVAVKRVYDALSSSDGTRVLVDRVWPRGLKKEESAIKLWLRELAPSSELCENFRSNQFEWSMFRKRYLKELTGDKATEAVAKLHRLSEGKRTVTLLYASKDEDHNNAVVLKELLEGMRKPPSSVGQGAQGRGRIRKAKRQ